MQIASTDWQPKCKLTNIFMVTDFDTFALCKNYNCGAYVVISELFIFYTTKKNWQIGDKMDNNIIS